MKRKLLSLLLCLCLLLSACGGPGQGSTAGTTVPTVGELTYTITLLSDRGSPIADVVLQVYADSEMKDLICVERTDPDGKISFTASPEGCTASFYAVPDGYIAQDSYAVNNTNFEIVLTSTMIVPDENTRLSLGDPMCYLEFTAHDGTVYKLDKLLEHKKAVVLNFWYLNCNPCKEEFPYLQQAYAMYSSDVEVLAMNPVDKDSAAIAQRQQEMELTFPMGTCGKEWESIFSLLGYPTTVVIDRFGMISFVHSGPITDTMAFADLFAFFTADDYTHTVVEELSNITIPYGCEERPFEISGVEEFTATVEPGKLTYYDLYRMVDIILTIEATDAYVIYNDVTYSGVDGVIRVDLSVADMYTPAKLQIGTIGSDSQELKVKLTSRPGTIANPHPLQAGTFTTSVAAGNNQGVYYLYQAAEEGTLELQCISATAGVAYEYVIYNLTSGAYANLLSSDGNNTLSVAVSAGDQVQISVAAVSDAQGNLYPAAEFETAVAFTGKNTKPPVVDPDPQPPTEPSEPTEPTIPIDPNREINKGMEYTELYVGNAYHILEGETAVELHIGAETYFFFTPTQAGVYKFTASSPISYYGTNTSFIWDQTGTLEDFANNTFTINIKESNLGASYLLAVTAEEGVWEGIISVTRISGPVLDETDAPWTEYKPTHTPNPDFAFQNPDGKELTYVDVSGNSADYAIYRDADGFYHLGSSSGPMVYVDLGEFAPYLSISTMLGTTGLKKYFYDDSGKFLKKEDYTACMLAYVDCMDDKTGLYPLTDDLIYIFKEYGESVGWWTNTPTSSYLFHDVSNLNTDIAWMFACCFIAE